MGEQKQQRSGVTRLDCFFLTLAGFLFSLFLQQWNPMGIFISSRNLLAQQIAISDGLSPSHMTVTFGNPDEGDSEEAIKSAAERPALEGSPIISPSSAATAEGAEDFATSVWCEGDSQENRRCAFRNICMETRRWGNMTAPKFLFFVGRTSTFVNVPRDEPEDTLKLLDLGSTPGHMKLTFRYQTLPASLQSVFHQFGHVEIVDDPTLILFRMLPFNLYCTFHDDLLPMYFTLLDICAGNVERCVKQMMMMYVDVNPEGPHFDLYRLYSTRNHAFRNHVLNVTTANDNALVCFREAYAGLSKHSLWYDVGVSEEYEGPKDKINITGFEVRKFAAFVEERLCKENHAKLLCKAGVCNPDNSTLAVVFSRKENRKILNEEKMVAYLLTILRHRFPQYKDLPDERMVKLMSMEEHSLAEIICAVRNARLVTGIHGALFILTLFLHPGSIVLELFPFGLNPENIKPFQSLSSLKGRDLIHLTWTNPHEALTVPHPENLPDKGGIRHLPEEYQREIEEAKTVPRVPCCDHPRLVYRLYQDTTVDLEEFSSLVNRGLQLQREYENQTEKGNDLWDSVRPILPGPVTNIKCLAEGDMIRVNWTLPKNVNMMREDLSECHTEVTLMAFHHQTEAWRNLNETLIPDCANRIVFHLEEATQDEEFHVVIKTVIESNLEGWPAIAQCQPS